MLEKTPSTHEPATAPQAGAPQADRASGIARLAPLWPAPAGAAGVLCAWMLTGSLTPLAGVPALAVLSALALYGRFRQNEAARTASARTSEAARTVSPDISALIEALPDAALLVDARMQLRAINSAGAELLGRHEAATPFSFVIRAPQVAEAVREVRAGADPVKVTYSAKVRTIACWKRISRPFPPPRRRRRAMSSSSCAI